MSAKQHVERLRAKYVTLADMDEHNLAYRIQYEAIGASNPNDLAAKLIKGGTLASNAPIDEQAWFEAVKLAKPAAPKSTKDKAHE
jgi:hypothetical protein